MGRRLTIRGRRDKRPGDLLDQEHGLAHRRAINVHACALQPAAAVFDFRAFLAVDRNRRREAVPRLVTGAVSSIAKANTANQLDIHLSRNYAVVLVTGCFTHCFSAPGPFIVVCPLLTETFFR